MCSKEGIAKPGDNKFTVGECDEGDDIYLMSGPASDILGGATYALADSNGSVFPPELLEDGALIGSHDYYIAKVWCFGELDYELDQYGTKIWSCDGREIDNITQTDSLTGDIEFYAEQARNNGDFVCNPQ